MKIKRSIIIPGALLIYIIGMAIYAYPTRNPQLSYTQWGITIAISLVCVVVLYFIYRKRDKARDDRKNK